MNILYIIQELGRNKQVFHSLFDSVYDQMYLWKPAPNKWCLLEILCHLYDEEKEDFKARIQHTFDNPELPMKTIDPVGWVEKRKYLEQNYQEVLEKFIYEREQSIEWLSQLKDPPWEQCSQHPKLGELSASMFLANWLAHDYLHLRQISRTKYQYLQKSQNADLAYAGPW